MDATTVQFLTALCSLAAAIISTISMLRLGKTNDNVLKIEVATNSMKDALIKSTAMASHAEGKAEGNVEGRAAEFAEASKRPNV